MTQQEQQTAKVTELEWKPHPTGLGGQRAFIEFPNGYGASVVFGGPFYTDNGTYEIGVFHSGSLDYDNPVANGDVIGYLHEDEANKTLADIAALPAKAVAHV